MPHGHSLSLSIDSRPLVRLCLPGDSRPTSAAGTACSANKRSPFRTGPGPARDGEDKFQSRLRGGRPRSAARQALELLAEASTRPGAARDLRHVARDASSARRYARPAQRGDFRDARTRAASPGASEAPGRGSRQRRGHAVSPGTAPLAARPRGTPLGDPPHRESSPRPLASQRGFYRKQRCHGGILTDTLYARWGSTACSGYAQRHRPALTARSFALCTKLFTHRESHDVRLDVAINFIPKDRQLLYNPIRNGD